MGLTKDEDPIVLRWAGTSLF